MARLVVPGYPHHVTQRGSRKQQTFFCDEDYLRYLALLSQHLAYAQAEIWAYCLMPNHVHLVVVPKEPDSLSKLVGLTHRRYARRINESKGWQGHLWQERFHSFVMDEQHLLAAVRYVELNPVRAGLCAHPTLWRWSSVHAHLGGARDEIVSVAPMRNLVSDWAEYLLESTDGPTDESLRDHTASGLPAGNAAFVEALESSTGRRLHRAKRGRKVRASSS